MASLEDILNHVVLPPRLPGKQDKDLDAIARDLTTRLLHACRMLEELTDDEFRHGWTSVATLLQTSRQVNGQYMDRSSLQTAFDTVASGNGQVLVCYVNEQNAGLLMHRKAIKNDQHAVVFEAFEASPTTRTVLAAPNALRWDFPDRAVQIPEEDFQDTQFQDALAVFLNKASSEYLSLFAATATKAGKEVPEIRNPSNPALITHMLLSVLEAIGSSADVLILHKRVRDDVHLDSGEVPWRRLPLWLVLRVAAQRQLCLCHGANVGYVAYKLLLCTTYATLLGDCVERQMHPSHVLLLQKKLGRKLAKLESHLSTHVHSDDEAKSIDKLLSSTSASFENPIAMAKSYANSEYANFKRNVNRHIVELPRRVDDDAFRLTLPSSGPYLTKLLRNTKSAYKGAARDTSKALPQFTNLALEGGVQKTIQFATQTLNASRQVTKAATTAPSWKKLLRMAFPPQEAVSLCRNISKTISSLVELAVLIPSSESVHASSALLGIFELWAKMDTVAVSVHPMLADYAPLFPPDILNVLHLPALADMERLRYLQQHIKDRFAQCKLKDKTIFGPLDHLCFGARFAANSEHLRKLFSAIKKMQSENRLAKERHWKVLCNKYDELSKSINSRPCSCSFNDGGIRDDHDCIPCSDRAQRKKMKIKVCEDLLPNDDVLARAIVFELCVPECFAIYRSTTWEILTKLAYPQLPPAKGSPKELILHKRLAQFAVPIRGTSVTLGSLSKSFIQTHYKKTKMKAPLENVLLPFSSTFQLFDTTSGLWISSFSQLPTLAHRCGIHIPEGLRDVALPVWPHPPMYPDGPSSYATVASRPECPPDLSIHEFEAFQRLLSGRARRWFTMLVELAGANLNFSKEDSVLVLSHLALEAGPPEDTVDSSSGPAAEHQNMLGVVHCALSNTDFVQCLLGQLKVKLLSVWGNWRETNTMELLITLLLRVYTLVQDGDPRRHALSLLELARSTTLDWIEALRAEIATTTDSDNARRASMYAFRAALLCRHTFMVFTDGRSSMGPDNLLFFVKASVILQQSFVVDVGALKNSERIMLKRDIVMADGLRLQICDAIRAHPESLAEGICYGIGLVFKCSAPAVFSPWTFQGDPNAGWVGTVMQPMGPDSTPQRIDFHYTDGHLLVHGKTMGKLPDDIRDSAHVKELFQGQHLLTYPSSLRGMSHRLITRVEKQTIHFGAHFGVVTVLAQNRSGQIRELVPRHIFSSEKGIYDLPRGLVDDCSHWFNRSTGQVEICRSSKWRHKANEWGLNVSRKTAHRNMVNLVDPHSRIALVLRNTFSDFEDGQRLTVFQPKAKRGALSVELRHLDLSFFVNTSGRLECRELSAEIDPDQDAQTLYGYRSMIVLRDCIDPTSRSIIFPLGNLRWKVLGVHVDVRTDIDLGPRVQTRSYGQIGKAYARFGIDSTLGRLTCPPEPRLLYTKALLHAVTSLDVPDPLTGRTGEEEAVHTLLSGRCQPWMPLTAAYTTFLFNQLKSLAPRREFYPPDKKVLQTVTWDSFLPPNLQSDRYGRLVRMLLNKSDNLSHFTDSPENDHEGDAGKQREEGRVLEQRGEIQRRRFQCSPTDLENDDPVEDKDVLYSSRGAVCVAEAGGQSLSGRSLSVFQIAKVLRGKTQQIPMTKDISSILEDWTLIGGFGEPCNVAAMPISSFMDPTTVSERWGGLVNMCRQASPMDVMLALAQLSFAPDADTDTIHLLAAYSCLQDLSVPIPPSHASFAGFAFNDSPAEMSIKGLISTAYVKFEHKPIQPSTGQTGVQDLYQRRRQHEMLCEQDGSKLARIILDQWPERDILTSEHFTSAFVNVTKALNKVQPEWTRLKHNRDLSLYLSELQKAFSTYRTVPRKNAYSKEKSCDSVRESGSRFLPHVPAAAPSLSRDLVCKAISFLSPSSGQLKSSVSAQPSTEDSIDQSARHSRKEAHVFPPEYAELHRIVTSFTASKEPMRQAYGADLAESLKALENLDRQHRDKHVSTSETVPTLAEVYSQLTRAKEELALIWDDLQTSFSLMQNVSVKRTSRPQNWLKLVGLWPRLTPISLLELLRSSNGHCYGPNVQWSLVSYGCALTKLQRLQRMRRALQKGDGRRLNDELRNSGHSNWRPIDVPDWLLLEIDANLLIRGEQVDVARAIIDPASNSNSVLQLNMGKGKTSVIVPMVISVLADGQQMCRLIVPKALLLPTAQPVQSQLGGLVGRELRHIPFSRRLTTGANIDQVVGSYKFHHNDLLRKRGVLLTAPEHVLAFNLSGLQCLVDGKRSASDMIGFQETLSDGMCRDILDESDFTLAVRTQLVYPSGQLTAVDGAPYRWKLIESLLSLVEDSLPDLCAKYPDSINTLPRPGGGFPMVYILQAGIEDELHQRIVEGICNGRIPFFRPAPDKYRAQRIKSRPVMSPGDFRKFMEKALSAGGTDNGVNEVAELFSDEQSAANGLTLVRGLLRNSILITCLKKRWNVQYGLHPKRWPIAVPFEAKGVPSERSEFGHPDVSIIFTCLSFYFAGLTLAQFREGLQHILHHADDPATEYEQWTAGSAGTPLPIELRNWSAINVDDAGQLLSLWNHLRFTRPVIDHYLNTFVFPVHSRQFSVKLQASAWDLPLFSLRSGNCKQARTTGFSGTNDNKMMLPLTIKQEDLGSLRQTNAEVLTYLLQQRNRQYVRTGAYGRRWTEEILLTSLRENHIRVFIDAGAYILEKDNEALARAWLQVDYRCSAAVFFGETDNRAWVVFKNASVSKTPLVATPFADKLDECLVYFDEAHTRGVDLQLPARAMGALTLALGQTKDHTVQAAMRLRQLGSTQSVMFYAPPEVDQSIRDVCGQNGQAYGGKIESPQVVTWLLEQTCLANEQLQPLYTSHGMDFCRRLDAQQEYGDWQTNGHARRLLLRILEQPERQTIQQLYGTSQAVPAAATKGKRLRLPMLQAFAEELGAHHHSDHQAELNGRGQASGAFEEVEQEREVEHQVEQVRLQERKTKFHGLTFPGAHKSIRRFVRKGVLSGDTGYSQVFAHIAQTHIGKRYGVQETGSRLFVSTEFGRTLERANSRQGHDDFMRPVEWLLWSPSTETGLVVIPEEVEELLPILWTSQSRVHLVAYAAPVTRAMRAFSSLQFYALPALPAKHTLPPWLVVELGILAGRLYMSFEETKAMSQYLRGAMGIEENTEDGASFGAGGQSFCSDPVGFLLEWLPLLRTTQDIMHTPAAYVCQGRTLSADHAFFAEPGLNLRSTAGGSPDNSRLGSKDDSESEGAGGDEWDDEYANEYEDARDEEHDEGHGDRHGEGRDGDRNAVLGEN